MNLTEKYVAGLTLSMLAKVANKETAKQCAIEGLNTLAERDGEWVKFIKETYNIEIDYEKILAQYREAKKAVNNY
jgi:hypothetical protein